MIKWWFDCFVDDFLQFELWTLSFHILTDFNGFSVTMHNFDSKQPKYNKYATLSPTSRWAHSIRAIVLCVVYPHHQLDKSHWGASIPPQPFRSPSAMAEQKVNRFWKYFLALSESSALSAIRDAVITLFLHRKWIWRNLMGELLMLLGSGRKHGFPRSSSTNSVMKNLQPIVRTVVVTIV